MGLNTAAAAFHITPVVLKTLYKHYQRKAVKITKEEKPDADAADDILYDEAFHIVKAFLQLATLNTVESLQAFTNTHIVSPPWASVCTALVPLTTCNDAADALIRWFDPDELQDVVGGERWWQVRGLDGVEAEWVTERRFLRDDGVEEQAKKKSGGRKLSDMEMDVLRMESLDKVLLYVHGGGYFFGSINTHRYQILRYARKMKGRAFAVNYRKAPQYPWPCGLHDVLSAYLYLIRPPKDALHSAIPSCKIVVAGDSAGGGLCMSFLTVLRDLDLPMPAGAVLISPWVDLTHSFPSVMANVATDIIPSNGFIHKPSMAWPVDPEPEHRSRIARTDTAPPPKPGHADTLQPDEERLSASTSTEENAAGMSQAEMIQIADDEEKEAKPGDDSAANSPVEGKKPVESRRSKEAKESWEPKPPKVLMENHEETPLELRSQIQMYATNEQLTHPLVSPILQGSLGDLCPLFIIAGDKEALRDEVIYLAHRAACPEEYPPRMEAIKDSTRQMENIKKFKTPTRVHLQVYDCMCHVLTIYTFQQSVKYAYRSIAEFVKHVTEDSDSEKEISPFPELAPESYTSTETSTLAEPELAPQEVKKSPSSGKSSNFLSLPPAIRTPFSFSSGTKSTEQVFEQSKADTKEQVQEEHLNATKLDTSVQAEGSRSTVLAETPTKSLFPAVEMLRQRVDIRGRVRQMEAKEEIQCLRAEVNSVGLLKEAPARRWLDGQEEWDKKFKSSAKKVTKQRKKTAAKYERMVKRAIELGLVQVSVDDTASIHTQGTTNLENSAIIQKDRRWGPLDLDEERPPPSAIAGRRDTPDSIALLRKSLYFAAPRTTKKTPKRKAKDVIKAAFDPNDDLGAPPRQSVSEQQYGAEVVPLHGLKIWAMLMGYFGTKSSRHARKGKRKATSTLSKLGGKIPKISQQNGSDTAVATAEPSPEISSTGGLSPPGGLHNPPLRA